MPCTDGCDTVRALEHGPARWFLVTALAWILPACQALHRLGVPNTPAARAEAAQHRDEAETVIAPALAAGGTRSLRRAAQILIERQLAPTASAMLLDFVQQSSAAARTDSEVRAAARLYLQLPEARPEALFARLIGSPSVEARRLAWRIAVQHPSLAMKDAVSVELSERAARDGAGSGRVLSPEAARAIQANKIVDAYPLLRAALFAEGSLAYAKAMSKLHPQAAADDLLSYVAQVESTLITSGNVGGLKRSTVLYALLSFHDMPPELHHPRIGALFLYAQSPDRELAGATWQIFRTYAQRTRADGNELDVLKRLAPESMRAAIDQRLGRPDQAIR